MNKQVLLTINASSAEEAVKVASNIPGFTVDQNYGAVPIDPQNNEYAVHGLATQAINDPNVKGVYADSKIDLF